MTQTPEGQAEVQAASAIHEAAHDRWAASVGKAHPAEVEANYQAMNDAGIRLAEAAGRYPDAWRAAREAGRGLSTTEPGTPEPEAGA